MVVFGVGSGEAAFVGREVVDGDDIRCFPVDDSTVGTEDGAGNNGGRICSERFVGGVEHSGTVLDSDIIF